VSWGLDKTNAQMLTGKWHVVAKEYYGVSFIA